MLRVNCYSLGSFVLSALITLYGFISETAWAQIDLHAHLHMKPGMKFMLNGDFESAPRSDHWSSRLSTKATSKTLREFDSESRPKLIVISLYSHPYFAFSPNRDGASFDRKANVRNGLEQSYQEFKAFVEAESAHYGIAKNASEAREILKNGKTVIVLSIEGAWGTFETPEDYHRWIDERGVAIVTPVHLTPDSLGGNALMTALQSFFSSTFDFLESVWTTRGECLKTICKSNHGFTPRGIEVVKELMNRKVWIDFAHSNEIEVATLIELHEKGSLDSKPLPMLVTHTQLRKFNPMERTLGELEINYIRKNDGMIGLIPSQQMLRQAVKDAERDAVLQNPAEAEQPSAAKGLTCISSLNLFEKAVAETVKTLGSSERVALGSDINAPLDGLSPACGTPESTSSPDQLDLHRRGFFNYAQWNSLVRRVSPDADWSTKNLEHFLTLWETIRPSL